MIVRTLSFSASAKSTSDCDDPDVNLDAWIRLSQKGYEDKALGSFGDWAAAEGYVVTIDNIHILLDMYQSHCNDDGSFDTIIYVQKSWPDLRYSLVTSNGALVGPLFEEAVYEEYETITPSTESINIPWPTDAVLSLEWVGDVYTACGIRLLDNPVIEINSDYQITWGEPVFGTIKVNAVVRKEYWQLNVPKLEDLVDEAEETNYATVVAAWLGGIDTLKVNPPNLSAANCPKGGTGLVVKWPDDEEGEETTCYKRVIKVDACTKEVISDTITEVACPEPEPEPEPPA